MLLPGDEVIEVAGVLVDYDDVGPEESRQRLGWIVREAFARNPSESVEVKVIRAGQEVSLSVEPAIVGFVNPSGFQRSS